MKGTFRPEAKTLDQEWVNTNKTGKWRIHSDEIERQGYGGRKNANGVFPHSRRYCI